MLATLCPLRGEREKKRSTMTDTVNLTLPFIEAAQAQKHVTHNEALRILDTLVQLAVLDRDLNAPPASPGEGERWIVQASPAPSGAWAGHGDQIAAWQDGGWQFSAPKTGWLAYVVDEGMLLAWDGNSWELAIDVLGVAHAKHRLLGVGTTADGTNPFSAKLNNALWAAKTVAEGGDGDLRYKLSKESAANTLSYLFQDNFSGRAEIGLIGDDDFHFKVSPDGSTWHEGIVIDKDTGACTFPNSSLGSGHGQCRLSKSGANLLLSPHNGNTILINGAPQTIPDAGVTLAAPSDTVTLTIASPCVVTWNDHGLSAGRPVRFSTSGALPTGITAGQVYYVISSGLGANDFQISATPGGAAINTSGTQSGTHKIGTLRYIYAYMNSGTMTLEASTGAHATQAGTGIKIKNGNATRTLVGMAFNSSTAWLDSASQRLVVSWFDRRDIDLIKKLSINRSTTSRSYVELETDIRLGFLAWDDEAVFGMCNAAAFNNTADAQCFTSVAFDGTAAEIISTLQQYHSASDIGSAAAGMSKGGLAEGYHFIDFWSRT